jgi:hypothetical protein
MSLRKGRANPGPLDIPLHPLTAVQRNAQERNVKKKRNLAHKEARPDRQTPDTICEIRKFNRF